MTVAIPVGAQHVQKAVTLLNWLAELDGGSRHPCLLVTAREISYESRQELLASAGRAFCNLTVIKAVLMDKQRQPETDSMLFRTACDYCSKVIKRPLFWLSLDSAPINAGWLDKIESDNPKATFPAKDSALKNYPLRSDAFTEAVFYKGDAAIHRLRESLAVAPYEVLRPKWTAIQNLARRSKRLPSITLVYIHVPGEEKHWKYAREFVDTYQKFQPEYPHQTVIVCQGKPVTPLARGLFKFLPNLKYFEHDDTGWDIGGYIAASKIVTDDCVVCLGGSAYFQRAGWLKRIAEAWKAHGVGFYGATPTFEVSPHLCTSGFWCFNEILKAYPIKVTNRVTRYDFEHGPNACWKMVAENSLPVKLVTWDGEYDLKDWRKPANIYRRGDQSNALIHWHHYREYEKSDSKLKEAMASHSDTLTDPHYLSIQCPVGFCPEIPPVTITKPVSKLNPGDKIVLRRTAAIGDVVAATSVGDELMRMGFKVEFQTNHLLHSLLRLHPKLKHIASPSGTATINLDGAYETHPERTSLHFNDMFLEQANKDLSRFDVSIPDSKNWTPRLIVPKKSRTASRMNRFPKPWVSICPRSNSWAQRTVPDSVWGDASKQFSGTKFWLGSHGPAPDGLVECNCRSIDDLTAWISDSDLVVSVDSGPMHIAAAVGTPLVAILQSSSPELHLSDQRDFVTISPDLTCLNCQQEVCPINNTKPPCQNIDPAVIADAVNKKLGAQYRDEISAVVSIYRPKAYILNRGLKALLPQVSEIVVCSDQAGVVPDGAMQHPKIRYVKSWKHDIGYGRKANYGARHTNGKYILFHGDDVELNRDAVAKMRVEMVDGVGIVSCLLRFRDGTIQHAGKVRKQNERGWGHIDYRKLVPTYREATEQENTCGACILVRREAFYKAGCHDEDFYLYCEDDSLCLDIRRVGYRIVFTPHAEGVHDEHLSTEKTPNIVQIMGQSNAMFGSKWGKYLDHNATRVPLGNFDFLKEWEMLR